MRLSGSSPPTVMCFAAGGEGPNILPAPPNTQRGKPAGGREGTSHGPMFPPGDIPQGSETDVVQPAFICHHQRKGRRRKKASPRWSIFGWSEEMFTKLKSKCSKRSTSALEGRLVIDVQWQLYEQRADSSTLLTLENKEAVCCDFCDWLRHSWVANCVINLLKRSPLSTGQRRADPRLMDW